MKKKSSQKVKKISRLELIAAMMGVALRLEKYSCDDPDRHIYWRCYFHSDIDIGFVEIVSEGLLTHCVGIDISKAQAIKALEDQIRGETIAVGAWSESRREYKIPENI